MISFKFLLASRIIESIPRYFQMLIIWSVIFDTNLIRRKDCIWNFPAPFYFPKGYRRQSLKSACAGIIRCIRSGPDENGWFHFNVVFWFETHAAYGVVDRMRIKWFALIEVWKLNGRLIRTPATRSFFGVIRHFFPLSFPYNIKWLSERTCFDFPKIYGTIQQTHLK